MNQSVHCQIIVHTKNQYGATYRGNVEVSTSVVRYQEMLASLALAERKYRSGFTFQHSTMVPQALVDQKNRRWKLKEFFGAHVLFHFSSPSQVKSPRERLLVNSMSPGAALLSPVEV